MRFMAIILWSFVNWSGLKCWESLMRAVRCHLTFNSPGAASNINNLMFPFRSLKKSWDVEAGGICFELLKSVIKHMSAATLRQSVILSSEVPWEATFQNLA